MTAHHEIELKRMLVGKDAADRLVAALGGRPAHDLGQTNHVLDTANHALRKARAFLRLRRENGSAYLTAKGPTRSVGRSTGSKVEAEAEIDPRLAGRILAGQVDALGALRRRLRGHAYEELLDAIDRARGTRDLRASGHYENRRRAMPVRLPSGRRVVVEVDRTRFPGGRVDDEVEIEVPNERAVPEVERWLDGVLRKAGIRTKKSTPKIARFYASRARGRR